MSADREDWTGASTSAGRESGGGRRGGKTVCYERQISDTGRQLVLIETGPSSCSCEPNYNSGSSWPGSSLKGRRLSHCFCLKRKKHFWQQKTLNHTGSGMRLNVVRTRIVWGKEIKMKIIKMVFSYLFVLFLIHSKLTVLKSEKTVRFAERNNFFTQSAHFFG